MRGTAWLLLLSWSAPAALGQAAIESGVRPPHVALPVPQPVMPVSAPAAKAAPAADKPQAVSKPHIADKQLHDNVDTLIAVTGLRDELLKNRDQFAESDRRAILQKHPEYDPAFANALAKRIRERVSVDDFLNVVAAIYEKNYTSEDVLEMIRSKQTGAAVSPRLQAKMSATSAAVNSQIMGGFTELGNKMGAQIRQELVKQHPEWLRRAQEPFVAPKESDETVTAKVENGPATITPAEEGSSPNFVVTLAN